MGLLNEYKSGASINIPKKLVESVIYSEEKKCNESLTGNLPRQNHDS